MKPIVEKAIQHNCNGQDVPVYVIDIGTRQVAVAQSDVKKR